MTVLTRANNRGAYIECDTEIDSTYVLKINITGYTTNSTWQISARDNQGSIIESETVTQTGEISFEFEATSTISRVYILRTAGLDVKTIDINQLSITGKYHKKDTLFLSYRYKFNGKELDPTGMGGGGSTYDYGFRIYNAQIARFLSVDPLTASYPWYTPYQFAGNKPIIAIDIDGLEEYVIIHYYSNNKYLGTAILHIPEDKRILKEINKPEKYNGIMYLTINLDSKIATSSQDEKIQAFRMINRNNFANYARTYKPEFFENLQNKEQALFEGLNANFESNYIGLMNYENDLFVFEPDADKVFFESNSAKLTQESLEEIDKLIILMKLFPKSTFEIAAHTDNIGTDESNLGLSQKRAQSVVDYMVNQGISSDRLKAAGYGESSPRTDNSTEEGRSQNRRVEFKVIESGY